MSENGFGIPTGVQKCEGKHLEAANEKRGWLERNLVARGLGVMVKIQTTGVWFPQHTHTKQTQNKSVVKSSTVPHLILSKRHHGLSYHYALAAIACEMVLFYHIPGVGNPADVLSKHWAHANIWPTLQPILF